MFAIFNKKQQKKSKANEPASLVNFDFENAIIVKKLRSLDLIITVSNHKAIRIINRTSSNKFLKAFRLKPNKCVNTNEENYISDFIKKIDFSKIPDGKWSSKALSKEISEDSLTLEKAYMLYFQTR